MKVTDYNIGKSYSLQVINAKKLSEYLKKFYAETHKVESFEQFYSNGKPNSYLLNSLPAYINPIAVLSDNIDNIFESKNIYLLDGFLRMFTSEVPDIDIMVKVYDDNDMSSADCMKVLFNFNHWKLFQGDSDSFRRGSLGIGYFFDRGVCQFLNLKYNLDLLSQDKLNVLTKMFTLEHTREIDVTLEKILTRVDIIDKLKILCQLTDLFHVEDARDSKVDKRFQAMFMNKILKANEPILFDHIKEFFLTQPLTRLYSCNREDVLEREFVKVCDDFFVKYVQKTFHNKEVKTKEELKKDFAKQVQKLKAKYTDIHGMSIQQYLELEDAKFYVLEVNNEKYTVDMKEVFYKGIDKNDISGFHSIDIYTFESIDGSTHKFNNSIYSQLSKLYVKK